MATPAAEAPKKSRKLILIVVCVLALGGGAVAPMAMAGIPPFGKAADKDKEKDKEKKKKSDKTAIVPFGDVVVNLAEERQQRYLRVKIAILVDADAEKEATELVTKKKAAVKSALIGHLAGKSTKDVSGSVGFERMKRELLERIEEVMYPDGSSSLRAVLFEEYVVQ